MHGKGCNAWLNEAPKVDLQQTLKFFEIHLYFICLPACLHLACVCVCVCVCVCLCVCVCVCVCVYVPASDDLEDMNN